MSQEATIQRRTSDSPPATADEPRGDAKLVAQVEVPYCGGAVGVLRAALFCSAQDGGHGGLVLRLTSEDLGSSNTPTCRKIEGGVEVSVEGEAEALLRALAAAVSAARPMSP